jgi:hypothetical protein
MDAALVRGGAVADGAAGVEPAWQARAAKGKSRRIRRQRREWGIGWRDTSAS